jgi:hypothetical protein
LIEIPPPERLEGQAKVGSALLTRARTSFKYVAVVGKPTANREKPGRDDVGA